MIHESKYHYEVIAWASNGCCNEEAYHANCTTKREAIRIARRIRKKYAEVELNRVFVNADDENDYLGFEAITF